MGNFPFLACADTSEERFAVPEKQLDALRAKNAALLKSFHEH
jgi:hypothetical protein